MKQLSEKRKANLGCLFLISIIVCSVFCPIYNNYKKNKLIHSGKETIAYAYKDNAYRGGTSVSYYFYIDGKIFNHECNTTKTKYAILNNFYKVFYNSNNPNKSTLDFTKWVNPDSVENYFPKGQCPFAREIWKAKGLVEE